MRRRNGEQDARKGGKGKWKNADGKRRDEKGKTRRERAKRENERKEREREGETYYSKIAGERVSERVKRGGTRTNGAKDSVKSDRQGNEKEDQNEPKRRSQEKKTKAKAPTTQHMHASTATQPPGRTARRHQHNAQLGTTTRTRS